MCWDYDTEQKRQISGSQGTYTQVERNIQYISKQINKENHLEICAMKEIKQGNKRVTGKLFFIWCSQTSQRRCYLRSKFERRDLRAEHSR